jgi:D-glycero-alpha-D-manno-heptose 1-phosphate guanylyltransferase
MAETVVRYFGSNFEGMRISYSREQTPLGTGGAIRLALTHCDADHVHVFNGDSFVDVDFTALERRWAEKRELVMVAIAVDDTARYGRLELSGDRAVGFLEKGVAGPGFINAGCYVIPAHILDSYEINQRFSFETDVLVPIAAQRGINLFISDGRFLDIGTPEDYARASTVFARL